MLPSSAVRIAVVLVLVPAAGAAGCRRSIPEDRAPEVFGREICQEMFDCDCAAYPYASEEECALTLEGQFLQLQAEAAALGLEYEPTCAGRWLDFYRDVGCEPDFLNPALLGSFCDLVTCPLYHGDAAENEACTAGDFFFSDCQRGLACEMGICRSRACDLREGDVCYTGPGDDFSSFCAAGLVCDYGSTGTCLVPHAVGEACPDGLCDYDARCDTTDPASPVCVLLPGLGGDCSQTFACREGSCDAGICEPTEPLLCSM